MAFTLNYGGDDHSLLAAFVQSLPENGFGPLIAEVTFTDRPVVSGFVIDAALVNGDWQVTGTTVGGDLVLNRWNNETAEVEKIQITVGPEYIDTISFY